MTRRERLPEWLRPSRTGSQARYARVRRRLAEDQLHTVCEEACCPNRGECWGKGTATLLLLGAVCTRACRFCAVKSGDPGGVIDGTEPSRAAETVNSLDLDYVVLTSVTRDDLPDGGAGIYAAAARAIKERRPDCRLEALVPDFAGDQESLETVLAAPYDVVAHNVEVVRRLTPLVRDRRASFERSLEVLRRIRAHSPARVAKSSLMLGLGEHESDVRESLALLLEAGVSILTLGQYLQPTLQHLPVASYVPPERFDEWRREALALGFAQVIAGPLVRSSYNARECYRSCGDSIGAVWSPR